MKRFLYLLPLLLFIAPSAFAQLPNAQGWCEAGAQQVTTSGLQSDTLVQASYPQCFVQVNVHGGGIATIYSNDSGTPLANPFQAKTNGQWQFFAAIGTYDVILSGAGFILPITLPEINLGLGGGGGGGGGSGIFQGPNPWVDALANGSICNGITDDTTSLVNTYNSITSTGNEFRIQNNCNLAIPPNPFSTPSFWVTMHLRGRLDIGGTLKLAPLVLMDGSMPQAAGNVNFGFLPQAPITPSSCATSPEIDLSSGGALRNVGLMSTGAGYSCFTGIGINGTSIAGTYLENVSALTNSATAKPIVFSGSFGLRIYKSQFDPGPLGTNPAITLQDNPTANDVIRDVRLDDIFMAHQGINIGGGAGISGGPRDGFFFDSLLFENSTGINFKAMVNLDVTNNTISNLVLRNMYVADSSACTLNTGPNIGFGRVNTLFMYGLIGGGCIQGSQPLTNLFAQTSTHIGNFLPSGAPGWAGVILSDNELNMTNPVIRQGNSGGGATDTGIGSLEIVCPNDTTTGTSNQKLVKMTATGACITLSTGDTDDGWIGICMFQCGTTLSSKISTVGLNYCIGDVGGPTVGDYIVPSSTVAGACHDSGVSSVNNPPPVMSSVIGIAQSGSSGQWLVWLFGPGMHEAVHTNAAQTWSAAQICGTGCSWTHSGSGAIDASTLLGATWAAPPAIGNTTPAAGSFTNLSATNLSATGTVTLPSGSVASGDITPGTNTQCVITSGGISQWGNCNGTASPTMVLKTGTANGTAYSTTSGSPSNVDGTNLVYTVTIPVGWKMIISCSGIVQADFSSGNTGGVVYLYDTHTSSSIQQTIVQFTAPSNQAVPFSMTTMIVGDGNSHTFELQFESLSGSTKFSIVNGSGGAMPQMVFQMQISN